MKLKFELVNGYGVLVDEEAEIKPNTWYENNKVLFLSDAVYDEGNNPNLNNKNNAVIFAEKELNLEGVPTFEWRDFEVEKLASFHYGENRKTVEFEDGFRKGFKIGYKSNPAKYTDTDMLIIRNKLVDFLPVSEVSSWDMIQAIKKYTEWLDEYLDSLQKHPKYVVMETEEYHQRQLNSGLGYGYSDKFKRVTITILKLFTNSEGRKQGTVKELIW